MMNKAKRVGGKAVSKTRDTWDKHGHHHQCRIHVRVCPILCFGTDDGDSRQQCCRMPVAN
jgi:hypothetical protein